jgi:hypothetical protein
MRRPVSPRRGAGNEARSKAERLRDASFAEGGSTRMIRQQAAGPAKAGITGKPQNVAPGQKRAAGGPKTPRGVSLSTPAKPGRTGVVKDR